MSELIGIIGESGTGKSSSIETLDPKDTVIINAVGKPLPFQGWKGKYTKFTGATGNYVSTDEVPKILSCLQFVSDSRPEIKNIVIDDWQYTMSNEFMRRSKEKGFDKFTEIGKGAWESLTKGRMLRDDLKVFILTHSDTSPGEFGSSPIVKIKTIGKLLDEKINPMGLFTVLLFTDVVKKENGQMEYRLVTNNNGAYPAKSPKGMFEMYIPNDLKLVAETIDKYNN